MSTREIITLQFGHYSNFVGAHFWNIQELSFDYTGLDPSECNHDILYREGQSNGQLTYTPRLLLADLKGSLKTLPEYGGIPDPTFEDESNDWPKVEKIEDPQAVKNQYLQYIDNTPSTSAESTYNLEDNVNTWTDFLYPRFHPLTVNVIKEYQHQSEQLPFNTYPSGKLVWRSDYGEIFSDKIRKFVEECDSMQGFQVLLDATDGFAGLALGCIEHLVDEYSKTIFACPLIASHFPDNNPSNEDEREKSTLKDSIRLANLAMTFQELSEYSNLFVPMSTGEKGWRKPGNSRTFDELNYKSELYYHSSAILASALDTLSQKYRHRSNIFTLSDICADMTGYGRKLAAASLGLPFLVKEYDYLIDHLNSVEKPLFTTITPSCKIAKDKIFQLITVRGIRESRLKLPPQEAREQKCLQAYKCENIKEMMELYFQTNNFLSATSVTVCNKPLKVQTPFPKIFSSSLTKYGYLKETDAEEGIESVPVITGLHNGNFMADMLEKLHRETKRIKFAKLHKFTEDGLEAASFCESLDLLSEFKDNYEDDFEL